MEAAMSTTEMERDQAQRIPDVADRLLTPQEAAALMGVSLSTIRLLTLKGELPVVRPTGRRLVRFPLQALLKLLAERTSQPGAAK